MLVLPSLLPGYWSYVSTLPYNMNRLRFSSRVLCSCALLASFCCLASGSLSFPIAFRLFLLCLAVLFCTRYVGISCAYFDKFRSTSIWLSSWFRDPDRFSPALPQGQREVGITGPRDAPSRGHRALSVADNAEVVPGHNASVVAACSFALRIRQLD